MFFGIVLANNKFLDTLLPATALEKFASYCAAVALYVCCLSAPEAAAGRRVVDFKIVLFAKVGAGGGQTASQQLVLMLQMDYLYRGLHILSFHCFALHLLYDYFFTVYDV